MTSFQFNPKLGQQTKLISTYDFGLKYTLVPPPTFHLHLPPLLAPSSLQLALKHQGHILHLGKLLLPNKAALNDINPDLKYNSMCSGPAIRLENDGPDTTAYDSLQ